MNSLQRREAENPWVLGFLWAGGVRKAPDLKRNGSDSRGVYALEGSVKEEEAAA